VTGIDARCSARGRKPDQVLQEAFTTSDKSAGESIQKRQRLAAQYAPA
jgi:hypothetical protein